MSWLEKILPSFGKNAKKNIPEGLWSKCPECSRVLYQEELERLSYVCPKCDHHLIISARRRLENFLDVEHQFEIAPNLESVDPLKFKDQKKYKDRYIEAQKKTKEKDALVVKKGLLKGMPIVAAAFDFNLWGVRWVQLLVKSLSERRMQRLKTLTPLFVFQRVEVLECRKDFFH